MWCGGISSVYGHSGSVNFHGLSLQRSFLVDWYFVDRTLISSRKYYPPVDAGSTFLSGECILQTITSGPVTPYPEIMQGYVRIISSAQRYVYIQTPYFLPTEPVLFALKTAALGGVDVRVMVPLRNDARFVEWSSRSYLREVIDAGVKVSLYRDGFLHAKMLVCDDQICSCGSTNVDFRSFENNFEANVFIYDEVTAAEMRDIYLEDEQKSIWFTDIPKRIHPRFFKRLGESFARMLSPLM